jgi:CheY-like chemotaxis protein
VIGLSSDLLENREGTFGAQDLDVLGRILDNGQQLLGLIDAGLDLATVEAGTPAGNGATPAAPVAAEPPPLASADVAAPGAVPVQGELPLFGSPSRAEFSGRTVLVIDHDPEGARRLGEMIEAYGARVLVAHSGAEGLRIARAERLDLVMTELVMPAMTGWDVVRTMQADAELRHVPAIVVSALALERGGTVVGAADLVTKPVEKGAILAVLRRHLPGARP